MKRVDHDDASNNVPLEASQWTEIDKETGEKVTVTSLRRGVLKTEMREFESLWTAMKEMAGKSTREDIEECRDKLRKKLVECGLPTDEPRSWIRFPGEDWQPLDPAIHEAAFVKRRGACCLWTKRLEQLTEPLSHERLAGELLFALTQMLAQPKIDDHLWDIWQVVHAYNRFSLAVFANEPIASLRRQNNARAQGPRARHVRSMKAGDVIWQLTRSYWAKNSLYRNDASNTAKAIEDQVNKALGALALRPLKTKTIADYIRKLRNKVPN